MNKLSFRLLSAAGAVCALALASQASAQGTFQNGGFEDGTFSSWTQGSGYWWDPGQSLAPSLYQVGGTYYDAGANASAIVTAGQDPYTGNALSMVYSGKYSARVNNAYNDYSVSTIRQTVTGYNDPFIYFAWAAVLEASHDVTDSDNFRLTLTNDTKGTTLYDVTYNSANAPMGLFKQYNSWFYTDWQVQNLDVSEYQGDTFTLSLLASDCPYGGHAGYVYLDGFGAAPPVQGDGAVPEPSTYGIFGAVILLGIAAWRRRAKAKV
jgi:hypothetical protein